MTADTVEDSPAFGPRIDPCFYNIEVSFWAIFRNLVYILLDIVVITITHLQFIVHPLRPGDRPFRTFFPLEPNKGVQSLQVYAS